MTSEQGGEVARFVGPSARLVEARGLTRKLPHGARPSEAAAVLEPSGTPEATGPKKGAVSLWDVTGAWENGNVSAQLNQAGGYVTGWMQRKGEPPEVGQRFVAGFRLSGEWPTRQDVFGRHLIHGTYQNDPAVSTGGGRSEVHPLSMLAIPGDPPQIAIYMGRRAEGHSLGKADYQLRRVTTQPRISDRVLDLIPDAYRPTLAATISVPMTQEDRKNFAELLTVISTRLRSWVRSRHTWEGRPDTEAKAFAINVMQALTKFPTQQMPLVSLLVRAYLSTDELIPGTEDTAWDVAAAMAKAYPASEPPLKILGMASSRGVGRSRGEHKYEWWTVGAELGHDLLPVKGKKGSGGVTVNLGGGFLVVKKVAPDKWLRVMPMIRGGPSVGGSLLKDLPVTGSVDSPNKFTSNLNYRPRDFAPSIATFVEVKLRAGPIGGAGGVARFEAVNSERPALTVPASGVSGEGAIGVGAGLSATIAFVAPEPGVANRVASPEVTLPVAEMTVGLSAAQHFPVDAYNLSSRAMAELRKMCAEERALLSDPNSILRLEGHASTAASDEYNMRLSERRLKSVLAVIRDLLGAELRAKVEESARGESEAKKAMPPDMTSTEWQRVDVFVNSDLVLSIEDM